MVISLVFFLQNCTTSSTALKPDVDSTKVSYGVFCPTNNEEAITLFNKAVNCSEQNRIDEAKALYKKAIQLDPNFCDAMDNLGLLLRSEGKLDEATRWYKKSINIFPDNIVAYGNLAFVYRTKGDLSKAIETYQTVIEIDGKDPEGYYGLGIIYFDQQKYQEAIDQFLKAESAYIEKKSEHETHAQLMLGRIYFNLKKYSLAIKYFELSYRDFNDDPNLNFHLGLCYLTREAYDIEKARKYFNKAEDLGAEINNEIKDLLRGPNLKSSLTSDELDRV